MTQTHISTLSKDPDACSRALSTIERTIRGTDGEICVSVATDTASVSPGAIAVARQICTGLTPIAGLAHGEDTDTTARLVANAYRNAGWDVMPASGSWRGAEATAAALGLDDGAGLALDPIVKTMRQLKPRYEKPTLMVLGRADEADMVLLAQVIETMESSRQPFKILAIDSPDQRRIGPLNLMGLLGSFGQVLDPSQPSPAVGTRRSPGL